MLDISYSTQYTTAVYSKLTRLSKTNKSTIIDAANEK